MSVSSGVGAPLHPSSVSLVAAHHVVDPEVVIESLPHIIWTASPDGATIHLNRWGSDYVGWPSDGVRRLNWALLVHPDDLVLLQERWEQAQTDGRDFVMHQRIRRHDGAYRWHLCRSTPLHDAEGHLTAWIGTATDIEEQKQLEMSLRHSEREATRSLTFLRSIETAIPVGFKLVDRDFRVIRMNQVLAATTNTTSQEHIGRTVAEVVPDLWPQLEAVYRRALTGEVVSNIEVELPPLEGQEGQRHYLASYYPVWDGGEVIAVGNIVVDVTEKAHASESIARNLAAMVDTIATTVEYRDPYTAGHQRRVADIAVAIAQEMGIDACMTEGIRTAACIHDLGKISVPAEILSKPGRLSAVEFELIKQHPDAGYTILAGIDFPWPVAEMIRQHHERLDGSGYPRGLRGDDILLGARVIAVADVVEAMIAHRPYRPGHGVEAALARIEQDRGTLLDSSAVDACVRAFREGRLQLI